ncbi:MAG: hypothetical protein ACI9G9_000479 [Psychromonas sp.]|jgi:uncharacterized protein (TIGR02231 family)
MKKLFSLCISSFLLLSVFAAEENIVKSEITQVTVYSSGAQIHRTANYSISSGITQIVIEGVSQYIDKNSLQVKASGGVLIIDSKYSVFYPQPDKTNLEGLPLKIRKQIDALKDSLSDLNYDLQGLQNEIDVYLASKNILANNGAIRGQGKVNDSLDLLKAAMDYYTKKMMEINSQLHVLNRKKSKMVNVKSEMTTRLKELKNFQNNAQLNPKPKGPIHRITVTLNTKEYAKGALTLSYLVSQAGWRPLYDMRSELASDKINLTYKAQVFQNTGVLWENVRLNISTNNPYQNKTLPNMHPWYLHFNIQYQQESNTPRSAANMQLKKSELGYSNDGESSDIKIMKEEVSFNQSVSDFTETIDHLISAEFRIDLPYTIESNNEEHMVLIKNVDIDTKYKYYTVPKMDASVYLVAELTNLQDLQLVPAKTNIFFDGTYMGETFLNPSQMSDTLTLSLGKDPNIIVKRKLMKAECKEKIVGNSKEVIKAYNIEIKNLKSTNIEVVVRDQIPVTNIAEIDIQALELDKGSLDSKTGIIEWKFKLKSKESKNLDFKYSVKHDKDLNLYL